MQANLLENLLGVNEGLERWEPPSYLKKHFPYYVTGFDEDSRPSEYIVMSQLLLR